tara:strand:- start:99731 stop:100201 length:471 start_codon:yes stop_codon:yes gene_type:complete
MLTLDNYKLCFASIKQQGVTKMLAINKLYKLLAFTAVIFVTGMTSSLYAENENNTETENSTLQNKAPEKKQAPMTNPMMGMMNPAMGMMNPAMGMMNPAMGMMNPAMGMMNPMMGMMNPKQYEQWFKQQSEMMKNFSKDAQASSQDHSSDWWNFWK